MLASLNEIKDYLRVPTAETSLDVVLTKAINESSGECEKVTGRTFLYTGYSNEFYKGGGSVISLKNYPVDSEASFQVKDYDATGTTIIFDTADYAVDYALGVIRLRGGLRFTHGPDSARVTYSAGYHTAGSSGDAKVQVPDDLSRDVRDYAACLYRKQIGAISYDDFMKEKENLTGAVGFMRYARLW